LITLENVAARRAPLALASVSLAWQAGSHAIVGPPDDGGPLLLTLIAGLARPRAGRVRVLDGAPTDAAVRRQVAIVPLEPRLPEAMRVGESLSLAAAIRGEPAVPAATRLAAVGVEALVDRTVRSLSRAEARAVALAEAITSSRVRVLLVEEPLVAIDPRATCHVSRALRERATAGCSVVFTTGSMRDAGELADDLLFLRGGAVAKRMPFVDTLVGLRPDGAHLRILVRGATGAHALVAALARDAEVESIERDGDSVHLRGRDAMTLSRATGRAAVETGVDVIELRFDPPPLRAARAMTDGLGRGAT
jgi:ABC-type multidrug transport system ATPase subunit